MTVIQEPALREKAQRTPKSNRKSLSEAKTEFLSAVNHAVCELMDRSRYSRERATAVLLREIQQNDKSPTDSEIFHIMRMHGIGIEDARKTLTISRAFNRVRSERGAGALAAIDELTQLLHISRLLAADGSGSQTSYESREAVESNESSVELSLSKNVKLAPGRPAIRRKSQSKRTLSNISSSKQRQTTAKIGGQKDEGKKSKAPKDEGKKGKKSLQIAVTKETDSCNNEDAVFARKALFVQEDLRPNDVAPGRTPSPVKGKSGKRPFVENNSSSENPHKRARTDSTL